VTNTPFAVYDKSSGRVLRAGVCPEDDLAGQVTDASEDVLQVAGLLQDLYLFRVEDGALVNAGPDLETAKRLKTTELYAACDAAVRAGVSSAALGSAHLYPTSDIDQSNLAQAVLAGGKLWCQDGAGTWALLDHTAAQALVALQDFQTAKDAAREHLATLMTEVEAAATPSAVQALTWG